MKNDRLRSVPSYCFHREAAGPLTPAVGGAFTQASAELTKAMLEWKREFAGGDEIGPVGSGDETGFISEPERP